MKIWIVTYGDGFEFAGLFVAAFETQIEAELYALELNEKYKSEYSSYDFQEVTLGEKTDASS